MESSSNTTTTTTTDTPTKLARSDSRNKNEQQQQQQSSAAAAAASLQLLLRQDALLVQHELHVSQKDDEAVLAYAAALLLGETSQEARAQEALEDVQRKLALVESLAERVSRTSPKAVAGPLLRLHGYSIDQQQDAQEESTLTLAATRERCHRLQRQGQVLEGIAKRVESSLQRGLTRMESATVRLQRVLRLSNCLKQILKLQFESTKLQGYDLDDLRDLTRAASSIRIMQNVLVKPELSCGIHVVDKMQPHAQRVSAQVRKAAASLLEQFHQGNSSSLSLIKLGATLQVYYHLGELPQATWSAVQYGLNKAEQAMQEHFSVEKLNQLQQAASTQAKAAVGAKHKPGDTERVLQKKLRDLRAQAATTWASATLEASRSVWNLNNVLLRKTDPVTRQVFVQVVAQAPIPTHLDMVDSQTEFSVFGLYWHNLCRLLGQQLQQVLEQDKGKHVPNVAALYPAVRAAALDMLSSLYDVMHSSGTSSNAIGFALEDATSAASNNSGVLGGSAGLDDAFLQCNTTNNQDSASFLGMASADTWTRADVSVVGRQQDSEKLFSSCNTTTSSLTAVFQSPEWNALQGNDTCHGLFSLQSAFLEACNDRLCEPLQYMFPSSGVTLDDDGVAVSVLPTLPSRYDLQKLNSSVCQELALADPREGGGELGMVTMLCDAIVKMCRLFCSRAKGVVSHVGPEGCLTKSHKIVPSDDLIHDLKVSNVMNALATAIRSAPENTLVVPYRPATSVQHEEAANMCQTALVPALNEIETMVKTLILTPLCRALNRRIADSIAKVHHGTYLSQTLDIEVAPTGGTSFVQKHLTELYEGMADSILSKLPKEYASIVASTVATYSIYTFVSNISLIRPLGETAKLHITQDLADFELALEQFVFRANSAKTLSQMNNGKPYAELRAVRQMLFWTGLEDAQQKNASVVAKSLLRQVWIKDVRPSTAIQFLFSFAPPLLSSPHHAKRMTAEDYVVQTLVQLDGSVEDGEASAWMVTLECCDAYQQRESVESASGGDARVASILMSLGPELLRRYRH